MDLLPRQSDHRLLGYLTRLERKYVVENTAVRRLASGEVLIRQGACDETMYLVERGTLEVIDERLGQDVVLTTLGVGEVLGEMAFLIHHPRSATVRAHGPCVVRAFNRENLMFIAETSPEILGKISLAISEILSARLVNTLQTLPVVAARLIELKSQVGGQQAAILDDAARALTNAERALGSA
jgi:CRP-like cAMP-binding protein